MADPALDLLLERFPRLRQTPTGRAPPDDKGLTPLAPTAAKPFDPEGPGPGCRRPLVCRNMQGSQGPAGGPGTPAQAAAPAADETGVTDGALTMTRIQPNAVQAHADVKYFDLLLDTAELAYINRRFADAVQLFLWVRNALADAYDGPADSPYLARVERARIYLRQIELALDYYGLPLTYVPLVSYTVYKEVIDNLLLHGSNIERQYQKLAAERTSIQVARETAQATVLALDGAIFSARQEIDDATTQINVIETDIDLLKAELEKTWNEVLAANEAFKQAVVRKENRCGFSEIIQCVSAIAAIGSGVESLFGAISAAKAVFATGQLVDANNKPITGDFSKLKFRLKALSPIRDSAKDIAKDYQELKKLLNGEAPNVSALPDDGMKLLVEKDKFDAEVDKYLELPEARQYKELMHRYIDLALTRNQKILEYNALFNKRDEIHMRIADIRVEQEGVQSRLSRTEDPEIEYLAHFVERSYRNIRAHIVKLLYQASKAVSFMAGRTEEVRIVDKNIDTLRITAANLLERFVREKERRARPPQTFRNIVINLKTHVSAAAWQSFLKTGQISFTLDPRDPTFRHMSHVRISKIAVKPQELIRQKKYHTYIFIHHGLSRIVDETGTLAEFSHRPIPSATIYNADGATVSESEFADASGDYAGVSPFGPWTLRIPEAGAVQLDALPRLVLTLEGSYWPRA